jgi:formylglycine-generating enzyme required for sulfatase activity/serine/threonine protein kinase
MSEREIFEKAIEIRDFKQRLVFLDKACGTDVELRKRLDALLASHDQASGFLTVPIVEPVSPTDGATSQETVSIPPANQKKVASPTRNDVDDDDSSNVAELTFLEPSSKPGSIGRLAHYEILQVLGQGAFGIVFKAFDEKLHRYVAVKAMSPQLATTSPPRKRFLREARSVAAIKHENIVQVYSVEEQPLPYLVMEYIDGQTLQQKLDGSGPLDILEILHLGRQMAAGLAAAHEKGLIHRDIKPTNILIEGGAEQKLKITDFGLARAADDATMTRTGTIAGTPMYMAPEQAMGQTLDHRADLFSLGSVLYQMTCGRPPFRGPNAISVLKRVVDESPRSIRDILPDAPEWLCSIIGKLHAKNPDDRYQSAREVAELLARCQNELQVQGNVTCIAHQFSNSDFASNDKLSSEVSQSSKTIAVKKTTTPHASSLGTKTGGTASGSEVAKRNRSILIFCGIGATAAIIAALAMNLGKQEMKLSEGRVQTAEPTSKKSEASEGWAGWPKDAPPPAIAPFNADQAKQHQEAWAKYLKVPIEYTNSIGMKFRLIPPGEFTMGMTQGVADAIKAVYPRNEFGAESLGSMPMHNVRLTDAFYIGTCEVTQEQYERIAGTNPSAFSPNGSNKTLLGDKYSRQFPVDSVSFIDVADFCINLCNREELKPVHLNRDNMITTFSSDGYRLPTEAEWEYACRAGTTGPLFYGNSEREFKDIAWFANNAEHLPHPVQQRIPNPFGLYDTHGNMYEWCQDWYDDQAYAKRTNTITENPQGPENGLTRVMRGGNWACNSIICNSALRAFASPQHRGGTGFRLALGVETVLKAVSENKSKMQELSMESGSSRENLPATPQLAMAPFDADKARMHKESWAKHLKVPVEYTNSIGMRFRLIPPGEFMMGFTQEEAEAIAALGANDEHWTSMTLGSTPPHRVQLSNAYYLGTCEATQEQYTKVVGINPSYFSANGDGKEKVKMDEDTMEHPVETVSFNDAAIFCIQLSEKKMLKPQYFGNDGVIAIVPGDGYRLPTEAEWEWACRSGTTTSWLCGEKDDVSRNHSLVHCKFGRANTRSGRIEK